MEEVYFLLLEELLEEFIYNLQIENYSVRTIKGYKNNNLRFFRYLDSKFEVTKLDDVSPRHIKSYISFLKGKLLSECYMNGILKNIRSFMKYCVDEGYLDGKENPCLSVRWVKQPIKLVKTFNDDEVRKMINAYQMRGFWEARNKLIMLMLVDCGMRCLELCMLTHLDVHETVLTIRGKGNKQRPIYISPMLKKHMIKYERLKQHYFEDSILKVNNYFISNRGNPLTNSTIERVVKIAGKKAKVRPEVRCSPHTLRHYFAQKQLQNGLDVYSLSRLLGHTDIKTTRIYLQSIDDLKVVVLAAKTSPLMTL